MWLSKRASRTKPTPRKDNRSGEVAAGKNWRLKGGRTFVSDVCHKSGPYLPFVGKPWTSLWGAITSFRGLRLFWGKFYICLGLPDISCNSRLSRPRHDWIVRCHKISGPQPLLRGGRSSKKVIERYLKKERYLRKNNLLEKDIWGNTVFWRKIFEERQRFRERYLRKRNILERGIWGAGGLPKLIFGILSQPTWPNSLWSQWTFSWYWCILSTR